MYANEMFWNEENGLRINLVKGASSANVIYCGVMMKLKSCFVYQAPGNFSFPIFIATNFQSTKQNIIITSANLGNKTNVIKSVTLIKTTQLTSYELNVWKQLGCLIVYSWHEYHDCIEYDRLTSPTSGTQTHPHIFWKHWYDDDDVRHIVSIFIPLFCTLFRQNATPSLCVCYMRVRGEVSMVSNKTWHCHCTPHSAERTKRSQRHTCDAARVHLPQTRQNCPCHGKGWLCVDGGICKSRYLTLHVLHFTEAFSLHTLAGSTQLKLNLLKRSSWKLALPHHYHHHLYHHYLPSGQCNFTFKGAVRN